MRIQQTGPLRFGGDAFRKLQKRVDELGLRLRTYGRQADSHTFLEIIDQANQTNPSLIRMPGKPYVYIDSGMFHQAKAQNIDLLFHHPEPFADIWETWDVPEINHELTNVEEPFAPENDGVLFVLEDRDHNVIGYSGLKCADPVNKTGYLSTYILPQWLGKPLQNLGLGKLFWEARIEKAIELGYKKLEMVAHRSFQPSIHLARKFGFTAGPYQEKCYLFLERNLTPSNQGSPQTASGETSAELAVEAIQNHHQPSSKED